MKLPIGLFGGTFNPPHTAHFALVHSAREQLNLAQVLLIPAGQPWQKPDVLPVTHRFKMLEAATKHDATIWQRKHTTPYPLIIDTTESDLPETSYTISTLKTLRQKYHDTPLVWIMGSDQLKNLHTWRNWQMLLDYAHIAIAHRAGHQVHSSELPETLRTFYLNHLSNQPEQWRNQLAGHFIQFTLAELHVASSNIRKQIQNGINPHTINTLRPAVADYIEQNHLYKEHS